MRSGYWRGRARPRPAAPRAFVENAGVFGRVATLPPRTSGPCRKLSCNFDKGGVTLLWRSSENCQGVRMLKKVVCLALPGTAGFEFGVVWEVFGIDRSEMGGPRGELTFATGDPGSVPTSLVVPLVSRSDPSIA